MNPSNPSDHPPKRESQSDDWLAIVCEKVARLNFGSVQITVHDGRVTQVESVERTRFSTSSKSGR